MPLAALQAAGYMPMQPLYSAVQSQQQMTAVAAAAAAGAAPSGVAAEGGAASLLSDPHTLCTEGHASEGSRRAAMARGISAAAAGSDAVADLPLRQQRLQGMLLWQLLQSRLLAAATAKPAARACSWFKPQHMQLHQLQ